MPEGPEVHTIADSLRRDLTGKTLLSINYDNKSKYKDGLPGYEHISGYFPVMIEDVICKGKQIFFKCCKQMFDHTFTFYLNSTLGMEGHWVWIPEKHSNLWMELGYHLKCNDIDLLVIERELYFDDSRHFGNFIILMPSEYEEKLGKIGPDLITDEISEQYWMSKARSPLIKQKQICDFLMEQKYVSGIGNYLKAEILYEARIKPDRVMSNLSDNDLILILKTSISKARESYNSHGLTIKSYLDPDGEKGTFKRVVYGMSHDPFGNEVIQSVFKDKRTTHWVPSLQL